MKPHNLSWDWKSLGPLRDLNVEPYSLVSFDVFDTVLHRAVRKPTDVFFHVGERAQKHNLLDPAIGPYEFAAIREKMERNARVRWAPLRQSSEVTLSEIWQEAPRFLRNVSTLMDWELETEYDLSFSNPYVVAFIAHLLQSGKRICFTSDTYHSADFVFRLLDKAGLPSTIRGMIFVSSEHDANKSNGAIFSHLLARYSPLSYAEVLHIGDDLTSDYFQPLRLGMATVHLVDAQPSPTSLSSEILLGHSDGQDPLQAVRQLGKAVRPQSDTPGFFFEFGAAFLGPALSAFCAWVVDDAARRGIRLICPVMREGAIFGPLLRQAVAALGFDIEVKEFFTSRAAAFLPAMTQLDDCALAYYQSRRNFTLHKLIDELNLPFPPENMRPFLEMPLSEVVGNAEFVQWLRSDEVQRCACTKSAEARRLLQNYAGQILGDHKSVAFVDLGPAGNTLSWLAKSLGNSGPNIVANYLFHTTPEVFENFSQGHLYLSFLGNSRAAVRISRLLNRSPEPIEILLTGRRETTVGYKVNSRTAKAHPVTRKVFQSDQQDRSLAHAELGIEVGWAHFEHAMHHVGLGLLISPEARQAISVQLHRLLELPTLEEAEHLGSLVFDDNAGSDFHEAICGEIDQRRISENGLAAFMERARRFWGYAGERVRWPQGVVTRINPDFLDRSFRQVFNDMDHRFACRYLLDLAQREGFNSVTIYGGGKIGFEMVEAARWSGINVDFIVDSNPALHGLKIHEKEIVSLDKAQHKGSQCYVVASVAFAGAIVNTINRYYSDKCLPLPRIFSVLG